MQGAGPEVVWFLRIKSGVYQHLHEGRKSLICGPVQCGVTVHVREVWLCATAQQVGSHQGPTEHAGHHERGQALVICGVHRDTGLGKKKKVKKNRFIW